LAGFITIMSVFEFSGIEPTSEAKVAHWSDNEIEALFTILGKYWVIYQRIEIQLDKLMLLACGHENWTASQTKLVGTTNEQTIDSLKSIVPTTPDFARVYGRPDWVSYFISNRL
jgi:hypothetical protein